MNASRFRALRMALALMALEFGVSTSFAEGPANLDCKLKFQLTGWSAIYKHAEGTGSVTCEDGSSMPVTITVKGAGVTVGKSKIDNGVGKFSDVHNIADVAGTYAQSEVHAGVVKSGTAQIVTKGKVSLALAGTGEGYDLGIVFGEFIIKAVK